MLLLAPFMGLCLILWIRQKEMLHGGFLFGENAVHWYHFIRALHWRMKESRPESSARAARGSESVLQGHRGTRRGRAWQPDCCHPRRLLCQQEEAVPAECGSKQPKQQGCSTQWTRFSWKQVHILCMPTIPSCFIVLKYHQWDTKSSFS